MKTKIGMALALLACVALGIAACGGGGSGSTAGTGVVSKGVITGFGSVLVNGVKFDTNATSVVSDDTSVSTTDLDVGMMVRVSGKLNDDGVTGTATHIEYEDSLQGPAQNLTASGCTILGQDVTVTATTIFDGATDLTAVNAGQVLEVSGFTNADGTITATRIEVKGAGEAKIRGTVGNLDPAAKTFTLTVMPTLEFTVDYAAAAVVPDAAALVDGAYVKVKSATAPGGTTLTATKVSVKKSGLDDADKAEVEGPAADFDPTLKTFTVNGVKVDASGISLPAGFADGSMIEVEGPLRNGVLTAVECKAENESEDEQSRTGTVTAKTGTTLTVQGVEYTITATTIFHDDSTLQDHLLNLDAIAINDTVEIDGYLDTATNKTVATKIERK
jgi:hypothetical protein